MPDLPTGTVTFLLTDIEGSSRVWERQPAAMARALARHDELLAAHISAHDGIVLKHRGEGDSTFSVFARARDALGGALGFQLALTLEPWPAEAVLRVRVAVHTGEAELRDGDYFGSSVNRCARLRAIAHGGQTLLSRTTHDVVRDGLSAETTLRPLGAHHLQDLLRPEEVFQVVHPGLRTEFPPLRSLDTLPNNLPTEQNTFVGRTADMSAIIERMHRVRLLTLRGFPGSGKSRLALQAGAALLVEHPDGVWRVDVAEVTDSALLDGVVASALGVPGGSPRPWAEALEDYLRPRALLLILDNCEHLLEGCASLVDRLLPAAPGLRILATSRQRLGVSGEFVVVLAPLSLPPDGDAEDELDAQIRQSEALRLFLDRVMAAKPDFVVTSEAMRLAARICRGLDGLPLAIELAAASAHRESLDTLARRIDDPVRLLATESPNARARHRSLRAAIASSYDLLSHGERLLFNRLAVFDGGFTLRATEAVCQFGACAVHTVHGTLAALEEQSLVASMEAPSGDKRYRMPATVRAYGLEQLAVAGEHHQVRDRHAYYFLGLSQQAEQGLQGAKMDEWLERLEAEHGNLLAAVDWLTDCGEAVHALQMSCALYRFWDVRSHLDEGRGRLERILGVPGAESSPERARALRALGALAWRAGDLSAAESRLTESLQIARQIGDRIGVARTLNTLGNVVAQQGDRPQAMGLYTDSLLKARELGDQSLTASALNNLGQTLREDGQFVEARPILEEGLALARTLDDQVAMAGILNNLGRIALLEDDYARAEAIFDEALALNRAHGNRLWEAINLCDLGLVRGMRSAVDPGIDMVRTALGILRDLRVGEDDLGRALECYSRLLARRGEPERALRLAGSAVAVYAAARTRPGKGEQAAMARHLADCRVAVGPERGRAAFVAGRALSPAQALAAALADDSRN